MVVKVVFFYFIVFFVYIYELQHLLKYQNNCVQKNNIVKIYLGILNYTTTSKKLFVIDILPQKQLAQDKCKSSMH